MKLAVSILPLLLSFLGTVSALDDTNSTAELGQGPYHYSFGINTPFISACSNKTVDINFQWSINGFQYTTTSTFMSPAEESAQKPSIELTYISLNITNPAIGGTALCNTTVDGPIPTSPIIWRCDKWLATDEGTYGTGGRHGPRLSLKLVERNLTLHDGWHCAESRKVSGGSIQYSGRGLVGIEFSQCTGASSITGDWKPGQIYSQRTIGCRADEINVKPYYLLGVYSGDPFFQVIG
ncbi:hypothetical protein QBC40DRAFT_322568 [Triangularia verruculosa]|uniref:Uncharacterized protein n=1 Tax=Triangularia verruculosa TaxID=2587418 RepID=A0AAN6XJZ6_9PEZI|nr:hypothetical protein QBC40DRAFT_322568 [Triangularia verruculosa]